MRFAFLFFGIGFGFIGGFERGVIVERQRQLLEAANINSQKEELPRLFLNSPTYLFCPP